MSRTKHDLQYNNLVLFSVLLLREFDEHCHKNLFNWTGNIEEHMHDALSEHTKERAGNFREEVLNHVKTSLLKRECNRDIIREASPRLSYKKAEDKEGNENKENT